MTRPGIEPTWIHQWPYCLLENPAYSAQSQQSQFFGTVLCPKEFEWQKNPVALLFRILQFKNVLPPPPPSQKEKKEEADFFSYMLCHLFLKTILSVPGSYFSPSAALFLTRNPSKCSSVQLYKVAHKPTSKCNVVLRNHFCMTRQNFTNLLKTEAVGLSFVKCTRGGLVCVDNYVRTWDYVTKWLMAGVDFWLMFVVLVA